MFDSSIRFYFVRVAFIAGPVIMLGGSLAYITGIDMSVSDKTSYLEGIPGCYGIVMFIPIYWELSKKLAESMKILPAITYVTGVLGGATRFTHMHSRILERALRITWCGRRNLGCLLFQSWPLTIVCRYPLPSQLIGNFH